MQDHNHGHPQRDDMDKGRSAFENDGVGQLDIARIALRDYPR